jgi:glucokinase
MNLCIGVDIGGTSIKSGFFTQKGDLIEKWEIPTRTENGGDNILSDIASNLSQKMNAHSSDTFLGIGVGVPGPVTSDGIVHTCVNLGWGEVAIERELSALTGLKVRAANDANIAALGEQWKGAGKGYDSLLMVTLGTGVGGGVVIGGQIINGTNGAAGEIGHMPVILRGDERCNCGKYDCLEQVASATGIVKQAKKLLAASDKPSRLREIETITAKHVFDLAKEGDCLCLELVDMVGGYLGTALADAGCILNPDLFVIGGGVSKAGAILIDAVKKHYEKRVFPSAKHTPIQLAELSNDAGIYGAAKLILG